MGTNIEIKARLRDPVGVRSRAEGLSDAPLEILRQEDTYYRVDRGRLKLRDFGNGRGELIYYERGRSLEPRSSCYRIVPTDEPEALRQVLAQALGVRGVVRKVRHLYLAGRTRIHLDEVEGLGPFLELEVVLGSENSEEEGGRIARQLMDALGVRSADLLDRSYIDFIEEA